jgi:hypothetical protein
MIMLGFKTVAAPGGDLPVSFGLGALMIIERKTNRKWASIAQEFQSSEDGGGASIELVCTVVAAALTNGSRKAGTFKNYTEENVADIVDTDTTFIERVMGVMAEDMATPESEKALGNGQGLKATKAKP